MCKSVLHITADMHLYEDLCPFKMLIFITNKYIYVSIHINRRMVWN